MDNMATQPSVNESAFVYVRRVNIPHIKLMLLSTIRCTIEFRSGLAVKISSMSEGFKKLFFDDSHHVVAEAKRNSPDLNNPNQGTYLEAYDLKVNSNRYFMSHEVCPEGNGFRKKTQAYFVEICYLLEKQGDGRDGILLSNGKENIFFVYNKRGRNSLAQIIVSWDGKGWQLRSDDSYDSEMPTGARVFTRIRFV